MIVTQRKCLNTEPHKKGILVIHLPDKKETPVHYWRPWSEVIHTNIFPYGKKSYLKNDIAIRYNFFTNVLDAITDLLWNPLTGRLTFLILCSKRAKPRYRVEISLDGGSKKTFYVAPASIVQGNELITYMLGISDRGRCLLISTKAVPKEYFKKNYK